MDDTIENNKEYFNDTLYKKLNIDLLNMDDTDALCHYIEHGNK